MPIKLGELAENLDARLEGDATCEVDSVAPLDEAGPSQLTFLANPRLRHQLADSRAGAVLLSGKHAGLFAGNRIITENPYACFAQAAMHLHPPVPVQPGRHPTAVLDPGTTIAASAQIGAHVVVEGNTRIGERCRIDANAFIGTDCELGCDVVVHPGVVIYPGSRIGDRCVIHAGAVLGADGFGLARDGERWLPVPQIGGVRIGSDVSIGANTTIDRGALRDTVLGDGVKLDNLVQIAHNVVVGDHTVMAAQTGVAGSTRIGRCCAFGGRVGVLGHLEISDGVQVMATSLVTRNIGKPGDWSAVVPADENSRWQKNVARLRKLDELCRRLKRLERTMNGFEKRGTQK
ncbi:MAG: UDP-3-O-(3-hydroxymyristoyl)glucosamine N-acyltransferase [Gammaproteobacteria bacterium]|nr:UDP-3-O-(3-hydroxymyristoyl)glucosamine N-acyltransferase [Gammaproteobacteria bacterium]